MRQYLWTTGAVFGLIALAHLWRLYEEGARLAREPWWMALTLLAAGLCFWAARLLWSGTK